MRTAEDSTKASNPQSQSSANSSPKPRARPSVRRTALVIPLQEREGDAYFQRLMRYINSKGGQFLQGEDGKYFLLLEGQEISLNLTPENIALSELMVGACGVSTMLVAARIGLQRLLIFAKNAAGQVQSRRFSAISRDHKRIYIPISGGQLLQISEGANQVVPNITNGDKFWIKHPKGQPFQYFEARPQEGLADFERLLVNTQACKHPEMRWFVAMHEGLFPFVRDLCTARLLIIHEGSTQQGKTTGAERFTLLHGLGCVTGDATVASLNNEGDVGLLVLDNKEQVNFRQDFIDYCLFLSTGAERKRSHSDGTATRSSNTSRPVAVITSIEGVFKAELQARCLSVQYSLGRGRIGREVIENEIKERRHAINSALASVFQCFHSLRAQRSETPNPRPGFEAHFRTLCDLLRAFAKVAGKPEGWAEETIRAWDRIIREQSDGEDEESELEYPIQRVLWEPHNTLDVQRRDNVILNNQQGHLYITQCAYLLSELQRLPSLQGLPKNPSGFSRRIRSETFRGMVVLKENDAREIKELRRTSTSRPIGFFFPDDVMTKNDGQGGSIVIPATPTNDGT